MKTFNKVIIPTPKNIVRSRGDRPMVKRTIDRSKPKVLLNGKAAPDCPTCPKTK